MKTNQYSTTDSTEATQVRNYMEHCGYEATVKSFETEAGDVFIVYWK
jgi:hypothetical protein